MYKTICRPRLPLIMMCCLVLAACGGGGSVPSASSSVLQESELYHPVTNPAGAVERPGQTAVIGLQVDTSDLPPPSNLGSKGVEDLWFEVKDDQSLQMELDADTLAAIDRLEVRNQNNVLLATINASTPSTTLSLAPGRYQALLYASAADTDPVAVFVQYVDGQDEVGQARSAAVLDKAQSQTSYVRGGSMSFTGRCIQCDLSYRDYSHWSLKMADFSFAELTGIRLMNADLTRTLFFHAELTWANFSGANLTGANLVGANLTSANFSGANLTRASLTAANLTQVNFTGANLSGARWIDGRPCKEGSIGTCLP